MGVFSLPRHNDTRGHEWRSCCSTAGILAEACLLLQMDSDGAKLIERVAACLPCYSCGAGRSWQLWPGDFDEDAQPILTAPTPALAECLIPPSMADPFRQSSRGSGTGRAWDSSEGARIQVSFL